MNPFESWSASDWLKAAELAVTIVSLVVVPLVSFALRGWLIAKADDVKRQKIVGIAETVYTVVEAVASRTPGKIDDKLAEGLKRIVEELGRPLSEKEKLTASNVFAALAHSNKQ